jgi:hypothetical protein
VAAQLALRGRISSKGGLLEEAGVFIPSCPCTVSPWADVIESTAAVLRFAFNFYGCGTHRAPAAMMLLLGASGASTLPALAGALSLFLSIMITAAVDRGAADAPLECQPATGEQRFIPLYHPLPEMRPRPSDGLMWPGQANDANAVFEHDGVLHIMFQTDCTKPDSSTTGGICAGGKVGAHAFSHLVSEDGGVHWRRITDALIPMPGSSYDGSDGDCDGTVSFPAGIGPVIMWGANCGTGKWPPKPPSPPAVPPAAAAEDGDRSSKLRSADYPRVAVATAANATDPLLEYWHKAADNPVVWTDPTQPCSFPGRVWRSGAKATGEPAHWSMVGTGAREGAKPTTMANWNRYETTDPTLHGPWKLADTSFATKANGQPFGTISTPGFYPLPSPRPGEPTHIINAGMGGAFYTAQFDAAKEKLYNLSARSYHVGGSWGVAGQTESDGSILHMYWSSGPGGRAGPGIAMMSAVRVLSYDPASASLVTNPAPWYSKMHNRTLVDESAIAIGVSSAGRTYTPALSAGSAQSGASSDLMLHVDLPSTTVSFELRVLAGQASSSNATSIVINVSAANPDYAAGPRKGLISATPSFAPRRANAQGFGVLAGESTLDLRVLTDRSIIEVFAMGGRGTTATHDYPSDGSAMFHLVNWGESPLIVRNLSIASMSCGWA